MNWRSFVSDIVGASKSSMSLCENNLYILQLLSEEVFDFSRGEMTQSKVLELKNQFNAEFLSIYQLCQLVFDQVSFLFFPIHTYIYIYIYISIGIGTDN